MKTDTMTEVIYQSNWEEGVIETTAKLNLSTGEIFDIETAHEEETAELESLIEENILTLDRIEKVEVKISSMFEYCINTDKIYLFAY